MSVVKKVADVLLRRPRRLTVEQYARKLIDQGRDPSGRVILDPTPIAPPIGFKKQPSMVEIVREMVRGEKLRQAAEDAGLETFEQADDFDIGDEPELLRSAWENDFDPPVSELLDAGRKVLAERERARQEATGKSGGAGGTPPAAGGASPPEAF